MHQTTISLDPQRQQAEMKDDFVSVAVHELRNPLTTLNGYLSLFIEDNQEKFDPEQKALLAKIKLSTKQLMSLVDNILNISRIEKGALTLDIKCLDWVSFVTESVRDFQERALQKNIALKFITPENKIPKVMADQLRIKEVLVNLLSNAINYTPENGAITIFLQQQAKFVTTHIQDTGIGIAQEDLSKLFTKFFRVENPNTAQIKGTGLGLYIVKEIIQMHHGRIWVESKPGKGSTFSFSLPNS